MSGVTGSYFYGAGSQTGRNTRNPTFSLEEEEIDRISCSDRPITSELINTISAISKAATAGVFGYFAGHVFSLIDPIGGAIFGVTAHMSRRFSTYILDKLDISNLAMKIAVYVTAYFASIGTAVAVTAAAGFPIALSNALVLNSAILITRIITQN
jgi:hypothetical protein